MTVTLTRSVKKMNNVLLKKQTTMFQQKENACKFVNLIPSVKQTTALNNGTIGTVMGTAKIVHKTSLTVPRARKIQEEVVSCLVKRSLLKILAKNMKSVVQTFANGGHVLMTTTVLVLFVTLITKFAQP